MQRSPSYVKNVLTSTSKAQAYEIRVTTAISAENILEFYLIAFVELLPVFNSNVEL
jgi:hypothetical protein